MQMLRKIMAVLCVLVSTSIAAAPLHINCRCQPNQACWPNTQEWTGLADRLTGRLVKPVMSTQACINDVNSQACKMAMKNMRNPFYMQSKPGYSESQGWLGAWKGQPSSYAIEAHNTADVVAGVNFARNHNLRLVIKGAGHDYLGRNTAPNSLLIWTHKMDALRYDQSFVPVGASKKTKGVQAVTAGAGTRWIQLYALVTTKHHRYVQGGGCTTVGATGGFIQGGGFGSFSKNYGLAAASILQAKVVTADGKVVIANRYQNKDLFWALRGGGGGTYGVVTQMTIKTHALPKRFGWVNGTIKANSNDAYKQLIKKVLVFYRDHLNNKHWGEQIVFNPDNTIRMSLVFQGLSQKAVEKLWAPMHFKLSVGSTPAIYWWDLNYKRQRFPKGIRINPMKGALSYQYWNSGDSAEVSVIWYAYTSWWLPKRLFNTKHIDQTANLFYQASRHHWYAIHINKGLGGGSQQALAGEKTTSINPEAFHADALVIIGDGDTKGYLGVKGYKTNMKVAKQKRDEVDAATALFMKAAPNTGSYSNETSYFEKHWQQDFWGGHYRRLQQIKQKYDPQELFYCHHCVGSEPWLTGGVCRRQ